ncbi:MAG TPA: DNA-directed RNA polymerase subunit E'' [Nanoarchaeota archaeon]|nr:DNA-directed RNA polymerase subunit E'' [Nanoarchaeota archaeon]
MARKVCRKCRLFVDGSECPVCKSSNFTDTWNGRIYITNFDKSQIAKKSGIKANGEYAIKAR